jgi:peptidyl-dipeptidase Dcp
LQHKLAQLDADAAGIAGAPAFDVQAVCAGFIYALSVADAMIRAGNARRALVVGSEVFSRLLDFKDRTTCVLFGDGAGAVVLEASDTPGILATDIHADGKHVGLFLSDNFARSSKRSGAWMSTYRDPMHLKESVRPIVVNNNNFSQGAEGKPTLLSLDDARTLFHEFGHGLHGLLSQVKYPRLSGTSVLRDFVEFPSQVYENWLMQPQILKQFATHADTGEPMPDALLKRILDAQTFNQGFATVEYVSSALVDLALHETTDLSQLDFKQFEAATLKAIQMPPAIGMRHRLPHFSHLFSSNSYASAYYVYMWAEVLDADGFDAFLEAGDLFATEPANKLYEHIYSAGNRQDPMQAYVAFRGREPTVIPLLTKRGLT